MSIISWRSSRSVLASEPLIVSEAGHNASGSGRVGNSEDCLGVYSTVALLPPRVSIYLLVAVTGAVWAQSERPPVVRPEFEAAAVVPSAGGQARALAPGVLFSIYGERLGPGDRVFGTGRPEPSRNTEPATSTPGSHGNPHLSEAALRRGGLSRRSPRGPALRA